MTTWTPDLQAAAACIYLEWRPKKHTGKKFRKMAALGRRGWWASTYINNWGNCVCRAGASPPTQLFWGNCVCLAGGPPRAVEGGPQQLVCSRPTLLLGRRLVYLLTLVVVCVGRGRIWLRYGGWSRTPIMYTTHVNYAVLSSVNT